MIRGLERRGYAVGRSLILERRGAGGRPELLPRLLEELIASKVDAIYAVSYRAALAAKNGTTLPVVVFSAGDPVATGLADSQNRPTAAVLPCWEADRRTTQADPRAGHIVQADIHQVAQSGRRRVHMNGRSTRRHKHWAVRGPGYRRGRIGLPAAPRVARRLLEPNRKFLGFGRRG